MTGSVKDFVVKIRVNVEAPLMGVMYYTVKVVIMNSVVDRWS
jgi:hypothetical protein